MPPPTLSSGAPAPTRSARSPRSGLPAVFVPLPVGNGEQRLNAAPVVAAGGGLLVDDAAFDPAWVRANLLPLLADPQRRAEMGRAAAGFGRLDADRELARDGPSAAAPR